MLCSFWPVDNSQIWMISHGLHYWCTAVTLCTKCRPNSQSYKICAWNVLNIQLSRNKLKNWRGHIINLISMAGEYSLLFVNQSETLEIWWSFPLKMKEKWHFIVILPLANYDLLSETVLSLPYFTAPTYYCIRLDKDLKQKAPHPHVIEDRIQCGLHHYPSLLTAPLLSCPLHFLTSICVSTGDYPYWALSIVFVKPLLSNRTRKRLKKIWCWLWGDMSEGEWSGGWHCCGPAPWGNVKVS